VATWTTWTSTAACRALILTTSISPCELNEAHPG
jgi:hypothetical protein